MGNVLSSPMKLKPGMKVLVFTHPRKFITLYEFLSGLRPGKWVKFSLEKVCSDGWIGATNIEKGTWTAIYSKGPTFTVVRSTSLADNLTPSEIRTREKHRKEYRAKKLAATEEKKGIKATGEAGALFEPPNCIGEHNRGYCTFCQTFDELGYII